MSLFYVVPLLFTWGMVRTYRKLDDYFSTAEDKTGAAMAFVACSIGCAVTTIASIVIAIAS